MHANAASDRGGGSGGGSWRLPPDETLQVSDPKEKLDVSTSYTRYINFDKFLKVKNMTKTKFPITLLINHLFLTKTLFPFLIIFH